MSRVHSDGHRAIRADGVSAYGRLVDPFHEQLVADSQEYAANEQADDSARDHPAEGADQDHRHGRIDTAAEQERLEHVVGHARDSR